MVLCPFSFRGGAAVAPMNLRRLLLEKAAMEEVIRLRNKVRCRGHPCNAGFLAQRQRPHYKRWEYKHTKQRCAHQSAPLVSKFYKVILWR